MIPPILISQNDKIVGVVASIGALLGGQWFVGAAAGEDTLTNTLQKWGAVGCVGVCASVATAYLKNRAGTIKALSESRAADAATLEAATAAHIKRITEYGERQMALLSKDLEYARARADTAEQIAHQERMGKHDALEQLNAVVLHSQVLDMILREKAVEKFLNDRGMEIPQGPKIEFGRAVSAHDDATSRLLSERSESTKAKTVRIDIPAIVQLHPHRRAPKPASDGSTP